MIIRTLNLDDMNDVRYIKDTTEKEFSKNNVFYDFPLYLSEMLFSKLFKNF